MPAQSKFRSQRTVALPGSERAPANVDELAKMQEKATAGAPPEVEAGGPIEVTVIVRRKEQIDMRALAEPGAAPMSRKEFEDKHGADPQSVDMVKEFAQEYGLRIEALPGHGHRAVKLSGTQQQMEQAFGVKLGSKVIGGGTYRVREGSICLPESLIGHVTAVLGLDNRPQAKPHNRRAKPRANGISFSPADVGRLYGFPQGGTAKGQTIAILELGGGFREQDITNYFQSLKLPVPTVTAVSVDKAKNKPTNASSADGEVMLDIEVCAAVAPEAKIVVYFAPNTDRGFTDGIATAVHDTTNNPSVLSISWGGPESSWTQQAMTALDEACQSAAALGMTITVAAGDDGSTDGVTDGANHVDFPASSPHVLACGGTKLMGSNGSIQSEVVWNELANQEGATGGGVSLQFARPSWQAGLNVPPATSGGGRGVPDVAGDADPATGYNVLVDGQSSTIGGTSAVAPLWAGLIALANAKSGGKAGFVNPKLYAAAAACRDITQGNNGAFNAGPGWDPCTGLGSPMGAQIIQLLAANSAQKAKGAPQQARAGGPIDRGRPRA